MARAVSNSTLQVGLLSIPVALCKIKPTEEVLIGSASLAGNPVKMPKVDGVTGEALDTADIQKGVWDGDDFKPISAEALEELAAVTAIEVFEITEFIPLSTVPWERVQDSYFLAPQKAKGAGQAAGAKAMALLHRGMQKTKTAGVLKIMLRTRQHLAVVFPKGDGLYVTTLVWSEDWTQADDANVLEGIAVEAKMVEMAVGLITALTVTDAQAALDSKTDDVRAERAKLVEAALAGKVVKAKGAKKAAPVADGLEALLAQSLAQVGAERTPVAV
jgi:DNA end-binding protein Ku